MIKTEVRDEIYNFFGKKYEEYGNKYREGKDYQMGRHSIFLINPELIEWLTGISVSRGFGVKIFHGHMWQDTEIEDAALISNILWRYGMGPRVLKIVKFGASHRRGLLGWIGENLTDHSEKKDTDFLLACARRNFIVPYLGEHIEPKYNAYNWVGGKYVDFGGWQIDRKRYKEWLIRRIEEVTHWGKSYNGGKASYQSIPDWGVDGKRKTNYRIDKLRLSELDFKDKSVLDIGCNLGMMLEYARAQGATQLVGFDLPDVADVAFDYAMFRGHFDIEIFGQDLSVTPPTESADIVFFLAMTMYLGYPDWLGELTNEVCLYEGHALQTREETEPNLKRLFRKVEYLGVSEDRNERILYRCYK